MRQQHKWHREIKAWADGASIQWYSERANTWEDEANPCWNTETAYRIKPQLLPDLVRYGVFTFKVNTENRVLPADVSYCSDLYLIKNDRCNFKVTLADEGTGEYSLKFMEVL